MSKRIFDMGRSSPDILERRELSMRFTFWPEENPTQPSTQEMEITRLREIIREKDETIARLERRLGLRR